jgi:microcystin-dependent protein
MSIPPNGFNTNTSFNRYKGTYFNSDIDVSGGNIISRTGNLYLAPNSNIYTSNNQIQFDDINNFIKFLQNLRLDSGLILNDGVLIIPNTTLQKLQYISTISSDIQTQVNTINSNITTLTNNSVSLSALNTFSGATNTFTNNIRLDSSLLLNAGALTITNANLQKLQYISTISSDIQTQINNITSVSLSAVNVFSGSLNTFNNNIRLDGSLLLNAGATTITNTTLNKIQYLSSITSDIQTSLQTLTDKMSGFYRSETTGSYFFTSNLNTEGKFNTLTPYEIGNLTGTTEPLQIAINALKTKTDTTNINLATTTTNANDALQRTEEISFSATPTPQTNITNKLVTEELVFTTDLNDITPTTFGYLSGVTSSIQTQLNSKTDSIAGTIIQHISSNLQTNFPTRFLLCNGQSVSRTTYANLFTYIGTTYGSVDGNSFNVPNFQACFLRMASGTRTVGGVSYTPNAVGTIQQDSLEAHVHSSNLTGSYLNDSTKSGSFFSFGTFRYNATNFPSFGGGVSSSHRTSTETRPLNHAVYFYITC